MERAKKRKSGFAPGSVFRAKPKPEQQSTTYKYRDPEKRRAQVREAVKRYRERKKET